MVSSAGVARPTAAAAVRMLGGERASSIEVPVIGFSAPKYDSTTSALEHQREPLATGERSLFSGANGMAALFLANRSHHRRYSRAGRAYLGPAARASSASIAEVQSRQRMAELAHVNRFSTAGELTASIAHEINQPLGAILTNAETAQAILKSPSPDIAELKHIVNDIMQDDRRATEVIRRMRSLLKKAPFELKNMDFNDLARDTVEFLSKLAIGRKVELVSGSHWKRFQSLPTASNFNRSF